MSQNNNSLEAPELMDIIASQLRKLSGMEITDRNIGKCIAQSKEIGNLAGKAIALSHYELEKRRIGPPSRTMLPPQDESKS